MEPARVTSTFRSLLTITVIAALMALAVIAVDAPIYVGAFVGALLFVILDGVLPSSLVRARQRREVATRRRVAPRG